MHIRSATITDATEVARLIGELRVAEGLDEPLDPAGVLAYLADPEAEIIVASAGERADAPVLGVLSLRVMLDLFHGQPTALIQELVVAEGHRGTGIGGTLLDAAIGRARERGCVEIAVVTGDRNEAGQAAHRSRGFEQEGVYFERHLGE